MLNTTLKNCKLKIYVHLVFSHIKKRQLSETILKAELIVKLSLSHAGTLLINEDFLEA